jgi:hypothetical protein
MPHIPSRAPGLLIALWVVIVGGLVAEPAKPAPVALNLSPFGILPLGSTAESFSVGGGAQGALEFMFPRMPSLSVGLLGEYLYLSTLDPSLTLSVAGGGLKTGLNIPVLPVLSFRASASGGWFYGFTNGATKGSGAVSGQNPWASGGLGLGLNLSEYFSLNLDAAYHSYFGLYNGVSVGLMANITPSGNAAFINDVSVPEGYLALPKEKRGVKLIGLKPERIFPVFKNYYDDHPLAVVLVHNYDNADATNVQVTAEFKGYMDGPRNLKVPSVLKAGGDATIDVNALFNDHILSVSEASKLSLTFSVTYTQNGATNTETYSPTVDVLYRNAITWDDDRHVAAFISARDPAAFGYIRGVVSSTRDVRNHALSQNLETAMVLHEALKKLGIIYSKVPSSAFNKGDKVAVDTVQFPQETLVSKTGDCSDLTVLWCSLLESVGIETAAITTPGHIYMAFALDTTPEQAVAVLGSKDKFIIRGGKVWVPVETTMITDSFMKAWQEGARESDPAIQSNLAFYPIHDAWKVYAPIVVSGTASSPALPDAASLAVALGNERQTLMKSELDPRAAKLLADIKTASNPAKPTNSLGLLYARYGQYDKASQILGDLTAKQQYGPAFVNLGNIYLLQKQYKQALDKFGAWLNINPDETVAIAGQALAFDGLGDRKNASETFDRLSAIDAKLAAKYNFLKAETATDSTRAAEANNLDSVLSWKD